MPRAHVVKHLTTRLVLLLLLVVLAISGAFDYVRLDRERNRIIELTRADQRVFAETFALAVRRNVRRGRTSDELQEVLEEIRRRPGLVWAAVYDPDGHVVASAGDRPARTADGDTAAVLQDSSARSHVLQDADGKVLRYIQPVRWPDGKTSAVEIRQSLAAADREFARALREGVVSRLIVLTCFIVGVLIVTRWSIARPIRALIGAARAVGSGDLGQRIDVGRADELGQLAEEFNRMAEGLERAHRELIAQAEARLQLEREVQQAQKLAALGMLAAQVAHEIGTPLNVISGRAEVLARSLAADGAARRHLGVIERQTERITAIIRNLLDYARPRQTKLSEERLPAILVPVVDVLDSRCRDRGVQIRLELPPDLPTVLADSDQLQQVFVNLLTNAVDASPPDAAVLVTASVEAAGAGHAGDGIVRGKVDGPAVAVSVVDVGPGMSSEAQARVFQPFFSTKKRGHGTGLGLPIVEEIVRGHRGAIEVRSAEGRGTEVIVRIPQCSRGPGGERSSS